MTTPVGDAPLAPWVTAAELVEAQPDPTLTPDQQELAVQLATDVLFALSGHRWPGLREDTLRVTPAALDVRVALPSPMPWSSPRMREVCGCHTSALDPQLPGAISNVVSMTVAGTTVPPEQIVVEDRRVIRVTPTGDATTDPLAVNLWATEDGFYRLFPSGEPYCGRLAAVELVVEWGSAPPEGGHLAALALAKEFAKAIVGEECRLAGNVTSIDRQGVSVLLDPATYLDHGRTGEPTSDLWLSAVNPGGLRRAPEVWWPEGGDTVRVS
jgi:hypothetical protein